MMVDLESIRKYLDSKNTEITTAFATGYCRAMADCGYAVTDRLDKPIMYVRQQILREEAKQYKRGWDEAEAICQLFDARKNDFRAMILDCESVNDSGEEIDIVTGEPIKSPEEHRSYPFFESSCGDDGRDYEVAYVELTSVTGDKYRAFKDDRPLIAYLLWRDIQICDPINGVYLKESQPGGKLEEYHDVITRALMETVLSAKSVKCSEVEETVDEPDSDF